MITSLVETANSFSRRRSAVDLYLWSLDYGRFISLHFMQNCRFYRPTYYHAEY
jgi:hypothetical protein